MSRLKNEILEREIVQQVKQIIGLTGIKLQRINTGSFYSGGRYIKSCETGTCDFEGYDKHGRFVAIECKRPSGGKVSPEQQLRINDINSKGGLAFIATSGEQALETLRVNDCI